MVNDRYPMAGAKVRLVETEGDSEQGVVVYCWLNCEIKACDCYVVIFDRELPNQEPTVKPYILRYAASSLKVIEPSEPALMLRDMVVLLREEQKLLPKETDFDRSYRMGFGRALDMFKAQCDAFDLTEDLGWMQPYLEKWIKDRE